MEKMKITVTLDSKANSVEVLLDGAVTPIGMLSMFSSFSSAVYNGLIKAGFQQEDVIGTMTSLVQDISELKGDTP